MTRYGRADNKLPFPMLNFSTSVDQKKKKLDYKIIYLVRII